MEQLRSDDYNNIISALDIVKDQMSQYKEALGYESLKVHKDDDVTSINDKVKVSSFISKALLEMTREHMDLNGVMDFYKKSHEKKKSEKIRGGSTPTGFEHFVTKKPNGKK